MNCLVLFLFAQTLWIETTQNDFADGIYECNIYSSRKSGGTIEFVSRWDLNSDGYFDIVVSNERGGTSYVYWGSNSGFNASNRTSYPVTNGSGCDANDLDYDGYPELIFSCYTGYAVRIFKGSPSGPNPSNYIDLPLYELSESCFIGDFNKDGYLDIVVGRYDSNNGCVFWADSTGFFSSDITLLPATGQHNIEAGDFNKDTWLDLVFTNTATNVNYIYWGSASGYSPVNRDEITTPPGDPHGCSVADLNNDGFLDIVTNAFFGGSTSYLYIFDSTNFVLWQTLTPGECYGGSIVSNFNGDNYLDIMYLRGYNSTDQPIVYWGSSSGYSDANTAEIGIDVNSSGACIADFNQDGNKDLFLDNYNLGSQSYVLYGPDYNTPTSLPNDRDHHSRIREIGNVYDRTYREDYISSVFDADSVINWGIIEWDDSLPPGSNVLMYVRSGNTPVPDTSWSGWDSVGQGEDIADSLSSRYLQYRARLTYTNPVYLPYLFEVRIEYGQIFAIIVEPDQADSTLPAVPVAYDLNVTNVNVGHDTVDLELQHNTSWTITLYDSTGINPLVDHNGNSFVDVITDSNETVRIVAEVLPPASAQAGDVDSLNVTGYSTAIPGLQDGALLVTTIRSIISILVEPDQTDSTLAGVPVSYHLWVYNEGTFRDTVDLYYSHNTIWGISLLDSTGTVPLIDHNSNGFPDVWVNSNDSVGIMVLVYPAGSAQPGDADTLVLTGRSSLNPAVTDNATLVTRIVSVFASILVEPDQSGYALPGIEERYDLYVINHGSRLDTVDLHYVHDQTWPVVLYDSMNNVLVDHNGNSLVDVITPVDDSTHIILGLTPDTVVSGTEDSLWLIGTSNINTQVQDSAFILTTVGAQGTIIVFPDQANNGLPGAWVGFDLTCQNNQNFIDTVDVVVQEQQGWSVNLLDSLGSPLVDHNGNSLVDIPGINALGGEAEFRVEVFVPAGTSAGTVDTLVLFGYSGADTSVCDSAVLVVTVGAQGTIIIFPDQVNSGLPGAWVSFALTCQNNQNIIDTVDVVVQEQQGWSVNLLDSLGSPLVDHNGNSLVDIPGINALGGEAEFGVEVFVPAGTSAGTVDTLVLFGYSGADTSVCDSAVLVVTVGAQGTIIVFPDQVNSGLPGSWVSFPLTCRNDQNLIDTVDLKYTDQLGYNYQLLDSLGSPLVDHNGNSLADIPGINALGGEAEFGVEVFVPAGTSAGTVDTLLLFGYSGADTSVCDSAVLVVTVGATGTIIVFPDQVDSGLPGSWVSFPLTCRNDQNLIDTVDLRYTDQLGYNYQLLDSLGNPLVDHNGNSLVDIPGIAASGGEADFGLRVLIPGGAVSGTVDSILVRGYSGQDSTVHDSAVLVLSVGAYAQVLIMPDQSDSANCGDTLDYVLYVQNLGNMMDVIDLSLLGGSFSYSVRDMAGNLLTDTDSDGLVDVGLVPPFGGGESLLVRVYVPVVVAGVADTVVVRAHSSNNVLVYDDAWLVTEVRGGIWGLVVEPDQEQHVEVGRAVVFDVGALLHGNVADVVDLGLTGVDAGWTVTLADSAEVGLTDTDSDGALDLGLVVPEQVCGFKVRVAAPQQFDLEGAVESLGVCDFYVRGRCSLRADVTDSVHLRALLVPGFDVHNYRNPFHAQTQFIFSLPKDGRVTLEVYNRAGERVRSLLSGAAYVFGVHTYPWDGRNDAGRELAPGTYIYIMNFDANDGELMVAKKKAVILK